MSDHSRDEVSDLKQTIESLQKECRRKDHFIATLAHELRNPITALRAAVHLQELGDGDRKMRQKTFDIIARQTDHMERLIDDLMDISRLSRGKVSLDTRTVDLSSVAAQVFVDQQKSFEDVGVELTVQLGDEPIWIEGDPTRLTQVLGNLLNNARKATSAGDRVSVAVDADYENNETILRVSDTGVGMEDETVERIFDQFTQTATGENGGSGLGLGLAIVRGIVELHDGHVEASSEGRGQGSEFVVHLPLSTSPAIDESDDPSQDSIDERSILIVEDDPDVAQLLVQLLQLEGHRVELAYDADEALQKLKLAAPDAILCDLQLPGDLDGYAFCRAVKVDPRFESVHLVAMTGRGGEEAREKSFDSGFDEHLTKPVDLDELRRAIDSDDSDH